MKENEEYNLWHFQHNTEITAFKNSLVHSNMYVLQVKFDFRLNLIFHCLIFIIIYQHRKEQWKIKFNLKSNLTCNICTVCKAAKTEDLILAC